MIKIIAQQNFKRVDQFLAEQMPEFSRTNLQNFINKGFVQLNGSTCGKKDKVAAGDVVEVEVPEPVLLDAKPEKMDLHILYEDDDIVIVNKAKGMVVHPGAGNSDGTLVNGLLEHCKGSLSDINGVIRPGIVHRIDKDTSGVIVVAKNNNAHEYLSDLFKKHDIKRVYYALVDGVINEKKGDIITNIGRHPVDRLKMAVVNKSGKNAVTHFEVVQRYENNTLLRVTLETGRTHQIRVHMAYIGHPVTGDKVYGPNNQKIAKNGHLLHAATLGFVHPKTHKYIEFSTNLPAEFEEILGDLRKLEL